MMILNVYGSTEHGATAADPDYPWAFKFYGDKGTLSCDVWKYDFTPVGDGKKLHGDVVMGERKIS